MARKSRMRVCCSSPSADGSEDDEEMMLKWFELVNKKNELVRMETDLVYK